MFASTLETGLCQAFPDVCQMPSPAGPLPMPYPNLAQCPTAKSDSCSSKVFINSAKAFNLKTEIPMSQGDEAGSAGGMVSQKIMGEVRFLKGSMKVFIEGPPAVTLGSATAHNGSPPNAPMGSQLSPSQTKLTVVG
ncbi:MAG: DUF4150 domain-containing protein [Pseudomonadota bacterium]